MLISSNFDGGNIIVDSYAKEEANHHGYLRIRKDTDAKFLQWFYFKVQNVLKTKVFLHITNAHEAFAAEAWHGYQACISYDKKEWFRTDTRYDGSELTIEIEADKNMVYVAYFAPYSYEDHLSLIGASQMSPLCEHRTLGQTVEKRDLDLLQIGDVGGEKRKIWILGRQHAGESMASWFVKGMIERLLDQADPVSRTLLRDNVFYVVPSMNPDGAVAGNIRVNGAGRDLNREWLEPSAENSPEVYYVKGEMTKIGVDLCLDIHGDEELPYNFVSRIDGIPKFDERLKNQQKWFKEAWMEVSPDFQDEFGYPLDQPGSANLAICSKNIANTFNCLALTVEMPFKDNANDPDPKYGWSIARSVNLGRSLLNALLLLKKKTD